MFQIFLICIFFLNLHTMSPLQISDICRQSLLSIHFLQTIIQTLYRSHFQHQLEKLSFNAVYIDIFCRHLQTLFHVLVDNFIIIKKLLFSVQIFVNNCSSQTQIACLLSTQTLFQVFVDNFVDTFVVLSTVRVLHIGTNFVYVDIFRFLQTPLQY